MRVTKFMILYVILSLHVSRELKTLKRFNYDFKNVCLQVKPDLHYKTYLAFFLIDKYIEVYLSLKLLLAPNYLIYTTASASVMKFSC